MAESALRYARRKALHLRATRAAERAAERAAQRAAAAARHRRGVAKAQRRSRPRVLPAPAAAVDAITQELSRLGVGPGADGIDDMQRLLLQLQM